MVNAMEVWEAGSQLGIGEPVKEDDGVKQEGADLVAERLRRHRAGLPPLTEAEARPPSEEQMNRLSTLLATDD